MEELQEKREQEVLFDIKDQNIQMLDDKSIENLQKMMNVSIKTQAYRSAPGIMIRNGLSDESSTSYLHITKNAFLKFPSFMQKFGGLIQKGSGNAKYIAKSDIRQVFPLFQLKSAFISEGKYYFYTSEGQILTSDVNDFNNNGVYAGSLSFFGTRGENDFAGNTDKTVYENGCTTKVNPNGFIDFYEGGQHVGKIPGDNIFKIENNKILISYKGKFYKYRIMGNTPFDYRDEGVYDMPYNNISQMVVDYNKNFLLIVDETDEGSTLHIIQYNDFVNKNTINEIDLKKGVKQICALGQENGMICEMVDGSLKYYWHTFSKFRTKFFEGNENKPAGKLIYPKDQEVITITDSTKTDLLKSLEEGNISVDFQEDVKDDMDKIDHSIIDKIRDMKISLTGGVSLTLREFFDNANDEESINQVFKTFQVIQKNPQIAKVGGITKTIEKEIIDKKNNVILNSIFSELGDLTQELSGASDLSTLFVIKDKLYKIKGKRKNIQAGAVQQDKDLKDLILIVEQKISEYKESHKDEFETNIQDNLEKLQDILDDIENSIDISTIYDNPIYQETEEMISCLDTSGQDKFKKMLKSLIDKRRKDIKSELEKEKEGEAKILEKKKAEVEDYMEQVKDMLEDIDDITTVEQCKENDALVLRIRKLLEDLPSSVADTFDLKLGRIFDDRIFELRVRGEETKGVVQNLDTYGIDTALYYDEDGSEQVDWKIEGKAKSDGKVGLVIKLMNGETHEYDKSVYLKDFEKYGDVMIRDWDIKFDMTDEEFSQYSRVLAKWKKSGKKEIQELIKSILGEKDIEKRKELRDKLKALKDYYKDARYTDLLIDRLIKQQKLNPRSKVPPFDPDFIVLDEEKEILKNLSARLVDQKQNSGIEILEGGPGLGKTVMCEFLASVTNREIIRVQCSKMDPSDMFFSPTLKKGETSREPADWIKLMQKPGTIILFDEIDKLNDQCFERLHSLFDRSKSVYDPQLGKIKASSDCLFLGTRNSYDRMSNPILSRGRILQINYPPVLNEAYKISKYANSSILKKMSYEEFKMLYEKYVVRSEAAPTNPNERRLYDLVININHLLNVFTTLRKQYDSDEPFAFELSYRDARQIFVDYNSSGDFKFAMENVLIPKARGAVIDSEDKKTQENMVRQAIDGEMR